MAIDTSTPCTICGHVPSPKARLADPALQVVRYNTVTNGQQYQRTELVCAVCQNQLGLALHAKVQALKTQNLVLGGK